MRRPSILVIFLTVFIDLIGFGIVLPLLPIYSEHFRASDLEIGLIISSYSLMQFLFAPAWGRLSDRIGRRPVLLERFEHGQRAPEAHPRRLGRGQVDDVAERARHGTTILATGGVEYRGDEYGYGTDPRILTQQQFEALLAGCNPGAAHSLRESALHLNSGLPDSVVMILCVGPAEEYCSRICCTTALKNALMLKRLKPEAHITVVYRDIRTYGFKEQLYTKAREAGVLFVRYDFDRKPQVASADGHLALRVREEVLGRDLELRPDMLVLSMPVIPSEGAHDLSARLKVPQDMDGFFLEAHVKLRPVDFSSDGIFMAGLAHYAKLLEESIIQARAAAARATEGPQ